MKASIEHKPKGRSMHPHGVEVARNFLAKVTDDGGKHVDSAYFETRDEARQWIRDLYRLEAR